MALGQQQPVIPRGFDPCLPPVSTSLCCKLVCDQLSIFQLQSRLKSRIVFPGVDAIHRAHLNAKFIFYATVSDCVSHDSSSKNRLDRLPTETHGNRSKRHGGGESDHLN